MVILFLYHLNHSGENLVSSCSLRKLSVGATTVSGTLYLDTRDTTAYVNDEALTGGTAGVAVVNQISSKNAVVLSPFVYHHNGTTEQRVYSNLSIAYEFVALGASDWIYLYLDDSAIVTADTNLITATQLIDVTTAPAYSVSKNGWYNGSDRCIFAIFTDGSSNVLEFFHDGGELVTFADQIETVSLLDIGHAAFVDITAAFTAPAFCTKVLASFSSDYSNAVCSLFYRVNGQTGATGHALLACQAALGEGSTDLSPIFTDSSQLIEWKESAASTNTYACYTNGWYFPNGM